MSTYVRDSIIFYAGLALFFIVGEVPSWMWILYSGSILATVVISFPLKKQQS
ncbi:hypothetical protein CCICO_00165 [Corynebacterium ciconiae DSM 44920]|uniref:hypothetical protein n=1 Tax=Corynebacterium ciconiae TaxID=227319 RepID=UPI0003705EFA|nr:hypothetical protein [Corynebacterium ciconiae]WKD60096.1 hypothetical protein CCICO_00165 [Corynebacterium ciconiae DSM 44920]